MASTPISTLFTLTPFLVPNPVATVPVACGAFDAPDAEPVMVAVAPCWMYEVEKDAEEDADDDDVDMERKDDEDDEGMM